MSGSWNIGAATSLSRDARALGLQIAQIERRLAELDELDGFACGKLLARAYTELLIRCRAELAALTPACPGESRR